jgi:anti-anti-sigma factor
MSEDLVAVHLLRTPVGLYERASRHQQALQREFDLVSASPGTPDAVPSALLAMIEELDRRFGRFATSPYAELDDAVAKGLTEVDLTYRLPPEAAVAAARLDQLLDEADEYCRTGDELLTLATPPAERRFRKWFLGEFIRQMAGQAPTAWTDHDEGSPSPSPGPVVAIDASTTTAPLPSGWSLSSDDGVATLVVVGDLDLDTSPALRGALAQARDAWSTVRVDARQVDFLDSVAISVLVSARNRLIDDGGDLTIRASAAVLRSLELVGLDRALKASR